MLTELVAAVEALDPAERLTRLRAVEAEMRRSEAELAVLIAAVERDGVHHGDGHASVAGLLRAELRWSEPEITHRRRTARLVAELPATVDALGCGVIGVAQVRALGRAAANPRCGDQLRHHEEILLGHARHLSFDQFSLCVHRWEQLADLDGAHRDHEANHAARTATFVEYDGVGHLAAQGGALDSAEMIDIWQRFCDAEFRTDWDDVTQRHGDTACTTLMARSDAQRRWDALKAIFLAAASTPADAQRPESTLNIVMDAVTFETTLARMRLIPHRADGPLPKIDDLPLDQWRSESTSGVLLDPAAALTAVALHGHVRRVVFDSAGNVIDLGRRRRLFTGAAREAVRLQAARCPWAGCPITASRCHSDHLTDWQHGGRTSSANGAPLCPRHNRLKNHGYRIWRDPDGHWHTYRPDGTEIAPAA